MEDFKLIAPAMLLYGLRQWGRAWWGFIRRREM